MGDARTLRHTAGTSAWQFFMLASAMAAATITDAHLPTLAQPDSDPRIWLEDVTGEEALAWVKARNAAALSSFGAIALALASRHFCHAADLTPLLPRR